MAKPIDKSSSPALKVAPLKSIPPAYHRVHFLHQAALQLSSLSGESPSIAAIGHLSRHYIASAAEIARKAQVKLHPAAKRSICKHCQAPLVVGETATGAFREVKRVKNAKRKRKAGRERRFIVKCMTCMEGRAFRVGRRRFPRYRLAVERAEEEAAFGEKEQTVAKKSAVT